MATERGLGYGLSEAETAGVQRRVRDGETHREAAAAIGCCATPRRRWPVLPGASLGVRVVGEPVMRNTAAGEPCASVTTFTRQWMP